MGNNHIAIQPIDHTDSIQHTHRSIRSDNNQTPTIVHSIRTTTLNNQSQTMRLLFIAIILSSQLTAHSDATSPALGHRRPASAPEGGVYVATSSGILLGSEHNTSTSSVYRFLSVPYARAPLGALRFMRPRELASIQSDSLVNATRFGATCPQFRHLSRFVSPLLNVDREHQVSEDCLHLHIYAPTSRIGTNPMADIGNARRLSPSDKQVPVIVWLPGEGFDFADARQYDGSQLASHAEAIVIVVQYRVGVFGFLNAPSWNVTGNMGLHDQIMALRWINQNVAAFGGDPDNVTLMGRFSGSMSISSLITAPKQDLIRQSNGQLLFKRVALLSGITVDRWIIDPNQQERSRLLAETAQERGLCAANSSNELECLQTLPLGQLLRMADYAWRPSIDNEIIGHLMPAEAIKMNQFPFDLESVLLGETATEGTLCLMRHTLTSDSNFGELLETGKLTSDDLYDMIRDDSRFYFNYQLPRSNPIQRALELMASESKSLKQRRHFEHADQDASQDDEQQQPSSWSMSANLREKYLDACSSYLIKFHSDELKRNLLSKNKLADIRLDVSRKPVNIYHYELNYRPSYSLTPSYVKTASHGDDIPLIFGLVYNQAQQDEQDLIMSQRMMRFIGNFANGLEPELGSPSESRSSKEAHARVHRSHSDPSQETLKRSWSNEGQIFTIDLEKKNTNSQQSQAQSRNRELHQTSHGRAASGKRGADHEVKLVFVERSAWGARNELPKGSGFLSSESSSKSAPGDASPDSTLEHSIQLTNLDLTRQPSARQEAASWASSSRTTAESTSSGQLESGRAILICMSFIAILMLLLSLALAFALTRLQLTLSETRKLLISRCSLDATQSDGSQTDHNELNHRDHGQLDEVLGRPAELAKGANGPFCNMLNKLSNSQNHQMRPNGGLQIGSRVDIQGSSLGLGRRNSNSSDQIALRMNHESFQS